MSWKRRARPARYEHFAPYVPVAERRRQAQATAAKAAKKGEIMSPVKIEGRAIARTFWGKSWCDNLESYSDYSNRLPRGRTYVRNGSVIDLHISPGTIAAQVFGSSLYRVTITIAPLDPKLWADFKIRCAGKISSLIDLLQGRLDKGVLAELTRQPGGLFPAPKEIKLSCSCPDGARLCKHVAAVLYGVGARLDSQPDLFFTLRHADLQELITAAAATATNEVGAATTSPDTLAADDLSALFGVEIDMTPTAPAKPPATRPPRVAKPPTTRARPAKKTSRTPRQSLKTPAKKTTRPNPPKKVARPGKKKPGT